MKIKMLKKDKMKNINADSKSDKVSTHEYKRKKDSQNNVKDIAKRIRDQLESSEVKRKVLAYKYKLKDPTSTQVNN